MGCQIVWGFEGSLTCSNTKFVIQWLWDIYIYIYLSKNEEQIFLKNPSTKIDILKIKILLFYNIFILHKSYIISIFI